jgi:hypothetical protein
VAREADEYQEREICMTLIDVKFVQNFHAKGQWRTGSVSRTGYHTENVYKIEHGYLEIWQKDVDDYIDEAINTIKSALSQIDALESRFGVSCERILSMI